MSAYGTGRVEVFYYGQWGTICDDGWDFRDARVICRQLGYQYALRHLRGEAIPSGSGPIWLDDVACTGIEQNIASCSHKGWGNHDCAHSDDAGVGCTNTGKPYLKTIYLDILVHMDQKLHSTESTLL